MDKNLKIVRIPFGTDEWYKFRQSGIGASEIGTVLGINKYDTPVRLYHEKIGNIEPKKDDNENTFWGREIEEQISSKWMYWDGSKTGYIENFKNNKIIRKCRNINGYVINPDFSWLFASLDRVINIEGGYNLITGEALTTEAPLECKNMKYWMAQWWLDGMPIYHLAQLIQQMAIIKSPYGELARLIDGSEFDVEKIEFDNDLFERIKSISKSFWYDRVVPGKKAVENKMLAEEQGNLAEIEKWEAEIQRYEPEPDNTDAYKEYIEERFVKERDSILGTIPDYGIAKKDKMLLAMSNRLKSERTLCQNQLKKTLTDNGAEAMDFEGLGNVSWSEQKAKKTRRFSNDIKEKPGENRIEEEFKKLDLNY